jgi:hypothetical protein
MIVSPPRGSEALFAFRQSREHHSGDSSNDFGDVILDRMAEAFSRFVETGKC